MTESPLYELEAEVSAVSKLLDTLEADISQFKKELVMLRDCCEDLEGRSRHCNVPITGVREGCKHGKHHTLCSKQEQDNLPPLAFVVKCHFFPKERV